MDYTTSDFLVSSPPKSIPKKQNYPHLCKPHLRHPGTESIISSFLKTGGFSGDYAPVAVNPKTFLQKRHTVIDVPTRAANKQKFGSRSVVHMRPMAITAMFLNDAQSPKKFAVLPVPY